MQNYKNNFNSNGKKPFKKVPSICEPIESITKALRIYKQTTSKKPSYISDLLTYNSISDIEVLSSNLKYIPELLKWVLSTDGKDEHDMVNDYIGVVTNELFSTEDSKLDKGQKKEKEQLITRANKLAFDLNKASNEAGSIRFFCINVLKELNRINTKNGKAVFKIGNLGEPGNLHVLVKDIWIPVEIEEVANLLYDKLISWHGGGKNKTNNRRFRMNLVGEICDDLLEINDFNFKKTLNQHTAIFNDGIYDLTSKEITKSTIYKAYKSSFVPFDFEDIKGSVLRTKSEIKQALKELNDTCNNIGNVLVDRFPLSYLPDLKNFCEHFGFGLVNIKTDNNRLVIIDGKGKCGKSTIFKMLERILPHVIGETDIVGRYQSNLMQSSESYSSSIQFAIVYDDDASGIKIYAPNFKKWIRNLFRPFQLKYKKTITISNRQIVFALTNNPIQFTEVGDHITDRVIILKAHARIGANNNTDDPDFYKKAFTESEVWELLRFILRIGLAPIFDGTLQYTDNPKSLLRFEDMSYDSTREFLKDCKAKVQRNGLAKYSKTEFHKAYVRWFEISKKIGKPKTKAKFLKDIRNYYNEDVVGDQDFEKRRIDQDPGDKTTDFVYLTLENEQYFNDDQEEGL